VFLELLPVPLLLLDLLGVTLEFLLVSEFADVLLEEV